MTKKSKSNKRVSKPNGNIIFLARAIILVIISILIPYIIKTISKFLDIARVINFRESYIVYSFIFMILLFYVYSRGKIAEIKEIKVSNLWFSMLSIMALVCFALFFAFVHFIVSFKYPLIVYIGFAIAEFSLGLMLLFLAFFGFRFFARFYREFLVSFFILFDFLFLTVILTIKWKFFSGALALLNFNFLKLFFGNTSVILTGGDPVLQVNNFRIVIGEPCSGIESIIMFLIVAIFIFLLDFNRINKRKLWILIPGLIGMFIVSFIRILLLMLFGQINPAFAITLFHTNVGWILFVIYLMVFWYFTYPWLLSEKHKKSVNSRKARSRKIAFKRARHRKKVKLTVRSIRKKHKKKSKKGKRRK